MREKHRHRTGTSVTKDRSAATPFVSAGFGWGNYWWRSEYREG